VLRHLAHRSVTWSCSTQNLSCQPDIRNEAALQLNLNHRGPPAYRQCHHVAAQSHAACLHLAILRRSPETCATSCWFVLACKRAKPEQGGTSISPVVLITYRVQLTADQVCCPLLDWRATCQAIAGTAPSSSPLRLSLRQLAVAFLQGAAALELESAPHRAAERRGV
jgi:hypothetical protein